MQVRYNNRVIRVLVVDDSLVYREAISRGLASDPAIEIIGAAVDPFDARDKIEALHPDVMICDIEMPRMSGIEFIRRLLPQYPLPVIVVSAISGAVFDALHAGAVDFVSKPDIRSADGVARFTLQLIEKVKAASVARVGVESAAAASPAPARVRQAETAVTTGAHASSSDRLIVMGASTGGTEAIASILKHLPSTMPGIAIVQHIPPVFSKMLADRLNQTTSLSVKEAETGDYLAPGRVLIAGGGQHLRLRKIGDRYRAECFDGEKVSGHCPSIDILFESAAKECGSRTIGVLLTGMGYDGAKGMLALKRRGAVTIGQDERTSVVYGMPRAAFELGAVGRQAALEDIPSLLCRAVRG
jgi:two-component system, chemotaxis family, protein-glutamate methylesterase/glutaminase